ncbi:hypothetical protein O9K51_00431 [Purpureocillium lavendulum]|uniref:Glycosyl hydrolase family 13 catalytic domain-containing protein n=1 Tax=Purpureocillium lavendulum TaxID=1247861 RepID=A0AB34G3R9_9HYPO|nr:hypothetical protein O9K51_00431 [Purpureocillium lavendulum]
MFAGTRPRLVDCSARESNRIRDVTMGSQVEQPRSWWKESSVYQIYPASFQDSTGSGVGDLKGIISRVDYLKDLGVDIVWLSPIFKSPQHDMGYDISDYRSIDPPYGDISDVDVLRDRLHERGMKLVLDLVMNHTSDEHPWFQESRKSRDNPFRDWYVWRPPRYDAQGNRQPPNNWESHFQGSAWEWDEATGEYYLHLFCREQPDLNWENPAVRRAAHDVMCFWLDRGADGFRIDVINFISKDQAFPDSKEHVLKGHEFYACGPRLHEYLKELGAILKEYDAFSVGEMPCVHDQDELIKAVGAGRDELSMIFHFELMDIDHGSNGKFSAQTWPLSRLKQTVNKWQRLMYDRNGWNALYLENHDQPRSVSRFASDDPEHRAASAKLIAVFLGFQAGTPFIYQGQEIGMVNVPKDWPMEEYKDIDCVNHWAADGARKSLYKDSADEETKAKLKVEYQKKSRDNARTPMQWDASPHAGFTTADATPWMRVHDNFTTVNAASQTSDPQSVYHTWRRVLEKRKALKDVFVYGDFALVDEANDDVFAYERRASAGAGGDAALVVCNFSGADRAWKWDGAPPRDVLVSTAGKGLKDVSGGEIRLGPWEASKEAKRPQTPSLILVDQLANGLALLHDPSSLVLADAHVVPDETHRQLRHEHRLDKRRGAAAGDDAVVDGPRLEQAAELADEIVAHEVEAARAVVPRVEVVLPAHRPGLSGGDLVREGGAVVRGLAVDDAEQVVAVLCEALRQGVPLQVGNLVCCLTFILFPLEKSSRAALSTGPPHHGQTGAAASTTVARTPSPAPPVLWSVSDPISAWTLNWENDVGILNTAGGGDGDLAASTRFLGRSLGGGFFLADSNDSIELTVLIFLRGGDRTAALCSLSPRASFNEAFVDGGGGELLGTRSFPELAVVAEFSTSCELARSSSSLFLFAFPVVPRNVVRWMPPLAALSSSELQELSSKASTSALLVENSAVADVSWTLGTSANRAQSDDEFYDVDDDESQAISRSRLRIDEARSRFLPASVDANGVDFSDRVDGKRKSYKASSRRQRILDDGTEELGDLSDDDDEESLERKIARLKREVAEAKEDYAKLKADAATKEHATHSDERLDSLSELLDGISTPLGVSSGNGAVKAFQPKAVTDDATATDGPTYTVTYAPTYEQSHALAKAADFDRRLLLLEKALGISSSSAPEAGQDGLPRAILPTLDSMEKQISTLSQASTANLDAISRRVRTLASEQDKLNDSREKAKVLREELGKHAPASPSDESEQEAKINALYGILPTIENLTPMLPPLLDRLRSLRAIHADAATASQTLERIETQQAEMTAELRQWKDGLEKMEGAIKDGDATVKGNAKVMEGWVKDLEERMAKLA